MSMEKQQNCDSMTTVTVKDFNPQMDYQEPPPVWLLTFKNIYFIRWLVILYAFKNLMKCMHSYAFH